MESYRKRYFDCHILEKVPCDNKKGYKNVYVYIGDWYRWNLSAETLRKTKRSYGLLLFFSIATYLAAGLQFSELNTVGLIAIPSIFSLVGLIYEFLGVIQFCAAKEKMKEMDIHEIQNRVGYGSLVHALMMFVTAAACTLLILTERYAARNLLMAVSYLLSGLLSGRIYRLQKPIDAIKCPAQ